MTVLFLPHKNVQPVTVNLPSSVADIAFKRDLGALCSHFEHYPDNDVEMIVVDRGYLADAFMGPHTLGAFIDKHKIPALITDDLVGHLSREFSHGLYPATTIGVISNEVVTEPPILGCVLKAAVRAIRANAAQEAQGAIYDVLKGGDWVLDPDYANQRGRGLIEPTL